MDVLPEHLMVGVAIYPLDEGGGALLTEVVYARLPQRSATDLPPDTLARFSEAVTEAAAGIDRFPQYPASWAADLLLPALAKHGLVLVRERP